MMIQRFKRNVQIKGCKSVSGLSCPNTTFKFYYYFYYHYYYYWKHRSILNFIANNLPLESIQNICADQPSFLNPSIITGEEYRPDQVFVTKDNGLYILEL